ncbi:MAG TPA: sigma-70 family RNA polymerase sigma factor [Ktedonobacteraceae bacterium]|nr:sigma-70 family RNA polymerase sigma factor [Ktedonobacteraceae bacterium]
MDDENELAALLAHDLEHTFRRLVVRYQDRLYAFAFRLTGSAQNAEDLVQEALLGAYITLSHYPRARILELKLGPWLYKVTLNVFRNHQRRTTLAVISLDLTEAYALLNLPESNEVQPEWLFEQAELQQEITELVASLPEPYRLVATCYYFEELSYQEIADLLDLPLGTVKSRLHRSLQMLRQNRGSFSQQRN